MIGAGGDIPVWLGTAFGTLDEASAGGTGIAPDGTKLGAAGGADGGDPGGSTLNPWVVLIV